LIYERVEFAAIRCPLIFDLYGNNLVGFHINDQMDFDPASMDSPFSRVHSPRLVTLIPVESTAITAGSSLDNMVWDKSSFILVQRLQMFV
jgi:hypothetical protein